TSTHDSAPPSPVLCLTTFACGEYQAICHAAILHFLTHNKSNKNIVSNEKIQHTTTSATAPDNTALLRKLHTAFGEKAKKFLVLLLGMPLGITSARTYSLA
ncbi:unnamed protein product, partial [Ceratitis capitata]